MLTALVATVAVSLWVVPNLKLDFGVAKVLEPSRSQLREVVELYDELPIRRETAVLTLSFPKEIDREELAILAQVTDALEAERRVKSVTSLVNVKVLGSSSALALPQPFPETVGSNRTVIEAAGTHPLMHRTALSADGKSTALRIMADLDPDFTITDLASLLTQTVRRSAPPTVKPRVVSSLLAMRTLRGLMVTDIIRNLVLEALVFALLLPLLMRTARGSLLPLLVVLAAVALNFGWLAYFGYGVTVIDVAIPGLVVIIGLCDAIHMIHRFDEELAAGLSKPAAIRTMLHKVGKACFYTSFTTAVGFASLSLTDHATVKSFGIKAAIAVMVTFLVVVAALPACLAVWPVRRRPARHAALAWLGYGRPRLTALVTIAALLVAGLGIARVGIDSHLLEELPRSHPVVQDVTWFGKNFRGLIRVEAVASGKLDDPDAFAALESFQTKVVAEEGVNSVEAFTMWFREALGNPPGDLSAAQIRAAAGRLRLAKAFPDNLIRKDMKRARIAFHAEDVGANRLLDVEVRLKELAGQLPKTVQVEPAGYTLMAASSSRLVIEAMTTSLLASLAVITLFMCIIFRSIRIGLLALLPNVLPLAVALGLSGWLGLNLRIGTALIYCLGLGLAVDDTIHIIARYLQERRDRPDATPREAMLETLHSSGMALITTSLVLGVGTLCYLSSSFQSLREVGILLFAVALSALVADLWVFPHLLQRVDSRPKA